MNGPLPRPGNRAVGPALGQGLDAPGRSDPPAIGFTPPALALPGRVGSAGLLDRRPRQKGR